MVLSDPWAFIAPQVDSIPPDRKPDAAHCPNSGTAHVTPRLPDFLIIGAMKAATSSLHDQLAAIPGVYMSNPKELYFFSDDPVYQQGIDWYASHFAGAAPNDLCGESTTHYTKLPTYPATIQRIREHVPAVRLIYVMRHPIDRLVSHYTHMWLQRETDASFSEAVDGAVPELIQYSKYSVQLEPFFASFGASRVLPVFFDRLHSNPDEVLQRVSHHIGLGEPVRWNDDLEANNTTSERLRTSPVRDAIKRLPGYQEARQLVPSSTIERIRRQWRPGKKPELTPTQLARVTAVFDEDLARLGSWLGTPLSTETFSEATAGQPLEWEASLLSAFPDPRTKSS